MKVFPDCFSHFIADSMALSALASLEMQIIEQDIAEGRDAPDWASLCPEDAMERKGLWLVEWENSVRAGLAHLDSSFTPKIWLDRAPEYKAQMARLKARENIRLAFLMMVELASFETYWPPKREKTDFMGLFLSVAPFNDLLKTFSRQWGLPETFGPNLVEKIQNTLKAYSKAFDFPSPPEFKNWRLGPVSMGICAPFCQDLVKVTSSNEKDLSIFRSFAAMGAGIASGSEFGYSGKPLALCGGGSLLGIGLEKWIPRTAFLMPQTLLMTAVKLETVIREGTAISSGISASLPEILTQLEKGLAVLKGMDPRNGKTAVEILSFAFERLKNPEKAAKSGPQFKS